MMHPSFKIHIAAVSTFLMLAPSAQAAVFPDVPDGHIHQDAVETLVQWEVVKGNPDGKFYPDRPVNRAEMLTMLYRATGKVPNPANRFCFKDVEPGSWYEAIVCDAHANKYVEGYGDYTFRAGQSVNRVEALKMITTVFGIPVPDIVMSDRDLVKFVDVSTSAWYTRFLVAAYGKGILPIPGQEGGRFYPDWPLTRSEAAAYIYNALNVDLRAKRASSAASTSSASSKAKISQSYDVEFPFEGRGKFTKKETITYRFNVKENLVAYTEVALQSGQPGTVSCRLYLMETDGYSSEYYLGHEEGSKCFLRTALRSGRYQLDISPSNADVTYTISSQLSPASDNDQNDGFREAMKLLPQTARTEALRPNDLQDWYSFVVPDDATHTVVLSNVRDVGCIIYAPKEVDLFGFESPRCNQSYQFPAGTYHIAVSRSVQKAAQVTYTITLQ